ncbi:hypothetical protein DFH94DRAFT_819960 [Russula ochroleuca]|uniref:Uncharacterized protein n=1 Tax=Russula ochroleuca TaxID=152965 RepID=A0A9P5N1I7_9AGAM|nr:hypothetical protein DFH94DRAFT_819960 [Russula ochroleuca]
MFSVKVALFAFISFAALALAIPSPVGQLQPGSQDPRALILSCNDQLAVAVLPLHYLTHANATSECVGAVIEEVVDILEMLVGALSGLSLSGCGCTVHDIIASIAITLKIIFEALGIVFGLYSGLDSLLGPLVALVVELLKVVLALVGGLVGELLILLISNGCAGIILDLKLGPLINCLGLGGLLGHLS